MPARRITAPLLAALALVSPALLAPGAHAADGGPSPNANTPVPAGGTTAPARTLTARTVATPVPTAPTRTAIAPAGGTSAPAATAPAGTTPAPGLLGRTAPQGAAARRPGAKSGSSGISDAAIVLAAVAALLALVCAAWALARMSAYEPRWSLSLRHSLAEAGHRASLTWAELGDWLRLGR